MGPLEQVNNMDVPILSGKQKPAKVKVHNLTKKGAEKRAKLRGLKVNRDQKQSSKYRHNHPLHPHEHEMFRKEGK